ncbi:tRNA selenocysteine 1-associated protein 1-like protein, partial [Dinothrombium tinctorium]
IEQYMDENFIMQAFALLGEEVIAVKIIRNKLDGSPIGYGFVSFKDQETAKRVLFKFNRRQIPNAPQGKKFKLNNVGKHEVLRDYTIFVGDLPPEIDDITLLTGFSVRYPSAKAAKVILNSEGRSKCFGFVKFEDEYDYEIALRECANVVIFGPKPIRVSVAVPKSKSIQRNIYAKGSSNIVLTPSNEYNFEGEESINIESHTCRYYQNYYDRGYNCCDNCYYCDTLKCFEGTNDYDVFRSENNPIYICEAVNTAAIFSFEDFLGSIHDSNWF